MIPGAGRGYFWSGLTDAFNKSMDRNREDAQRAESNMMGFGKLRASMHEGALDRAASGRNAQLGAYATVVNAHLDAAAEADRQAIALETPAYPGAAVPQANLNRASAYRQKSEEHRKEAKRFQSGFPNVPAGEKTRTLADEFGDLFK